MLQNEISPLSTFPTEGEQYMQENEQQLREVVAAIHKEIYSSVMKHGPMPEDLIHRAGIVCEESGELIRACINLVYETNLNVPLAVEYCEKEVYREAIHTAATAIKFLLSLQKGRQ